MHADLVTFLVLLACVSCRPVRSAPGVQDRADASAETGSSFFDTFMAFLSSSTLGADHGVADGGGQDAGQEAAPAVPANGGALPAGRSLGDLSDGAPSGGNGGDRVKRTGQIPTHLLSSALNHKLAYISKGSHHVHFHNYGTKCEKPHWSLWDFKKALLSKLLEAAKAIGGGVLALKGKLITAKGHLVAAKGRKLASKGEELTEFGKSILAKALGHGQPEGHEEVHTAPSAPAAPLGAVPYPATSPALYSAAQYLPPAPSGHGYGEAVSLLNEYSRGGYAGAAPQHHRSGQAPTGPSATGPAGTLPGNLQAGLLVLQPAPSASAPAASAPAASEPAAMYSAPAKVEMPSAATPAPHPLVFAPEYVNAMSAAQQIAEAAAAAASASESNKVRRYAMLSRRSLDEAMATVVRGLHGSQLLLDPSIVRSSAARIRGDPLRGL